VLARLLEKGFRATLDLRAEKIGAKIRDAQLEKIPAMLVVGAKEAENQAVSYRDRVDGDQGAMAEWRSVSVHFSLQGQSLAGAMTCS
jgi:threonyl-tRNA synthetase